MIIWAWIDVLMRARYASATSKTCSSSQSTLGRLDFDRWFVFFPEYFPDGEVLAMYLPEMLAGGSMKAIADGDYARIQPLTPGDHVLELGGSTCGINPFQTSVTYRLHVGN